MLLTLLCWNFEFNFFKINYQLNVCIYLFSEYLLYYRLNIRLPKVYINQWRRKMFHDRGAENSQVPGYVLEV